MNIWSLGLGGSDHDFSSVLMKGSDICVAIEQERLSRRKHGLTFWYESPVERAMDYCLRTEGIHLDDVEMIVSSDSIPSRLRHLLAGRNLTEYPHHLCHAASAYMMVPADKTAAILVYDGFGSIRNPDPDQSLRNRRETFSFFLFGPEGYRSLGATSGLGYRELDEFPVGVTDSIGMLYEIVTSVLGYDVMDSGKTMGLSSYGIPRYVDAIEKFVTYDDNSSACFKCRNDDPKLPALLEQILLEGRQSFAVRADLAASVQMILNKVLLHCARFFCGSKADYFCLSGGCALNTVANSNLVEHFPKASPLMIPPHCGDAGLGLGALWLEQFKRVGHSPELTFQGQRLNPNIARPGRLYSSDERQAAVQEFYPRLALDSAVRSPGELATRLANGEIIGVFNGRSEIGPRALGGRSIMADPRSAMTRERLNRVIKHREPFRPLAPIILACDYEKYFHDIRCADPFMLKIARVRDRCAREFPAIVHVDGTARVQVVTNAGDPFLIRLLESFREIVGAGILINTSFNRRGEPIVETPRDAIDAFLGMGLDGLYIDGEFFRAVPPSNPQT